MTIGVLSDSLLRAMIERGEIAADPAITPAQIQPASIDLRLGRIAYRGKSSTLHPHS